MRIFSLSALFIFFITGCASNDQRPAQSGLGDFPQNPPEISDTEAFLAQLDELHSNLDKGNPRALSADERRTVNDLTAQLRNQLADIEHIESLGSEEQERVNETARQLWETIIGPQESRSRCQRSRVTGSRLGRSRC